MFIIFNLPVELGQMILSSWLSLPDLSRLDISFCNGEQRRKYYEYLRSPCGVIFHGVIMSNQLKNESYSAWLKQRSLRVDKFAIWHRLRDVESNRYLLHNNGDVVQSIVVHLSGYNFEDTVMHCLKVSEIHIYDSCCSRKAVDQLLVLCTNLRSVIFWRFSYSDDTLYALSKIAAHLRKFRTNTPGLSTDLGLVTFFNACQTLHHVELVQPYCTDFTLEALGKCSQLRTLDLANFCRSSDAGFCRMVDGLQMLEAFTISARVCFSDAALAYMATRCCATLRYIRIARFCDYGTAFLSALGQHCDGLEELHLGCNNIAEESDFVKVARGCNRLRLLSLSCLPACTETVLSELVEGNSGTLESVMFENLNGLTNAVVIALVNRAPNLRSLSLWRCLGLSESVMLDVVHSCSQRINVNYSNSFHEL